MSKRRNVPRRGVRAGQKVVTANYQGEVATASELQEAAAAPGRGKGSNPANNKPTWAGSLTYAQTWEFMRLNLSYLVKEGAVTQHHAQALAYDMNLFNVLHEAFLLKMTTEQFDALPYWENETEAFDYAAEMMLPFRSIYFEVAQRDFSEDSPFGVKTADWASELETTWGYAMAASPYAFLVSRLPEDGGLWIIPFAQINPKGKVIVNDRGQTMPMQTFIMPTVVLGGKRIMGEDANGVAFRCSTNRKPGAGEIGVGSGLPAEAYLGEEALSGQIVDGLHSSTEVDISTALGIEGVTGRVLFSDCYEQQIRVQGNNARAMPGNFYPPLNADSVGRNCVHYAAVAARMALRAMAALSILDAEEVTIADTPMEKRDLRRAEKRGWKIAQIIRIGGPVVKGPRKEPTGDERHYTHRFWVRGHVQHHGSHTRAYQNREDLVTPCTRHGASQCQGGFCRKVKIPPYIKGPADKPLVAKSRVWAQPKEKSA